MSMRSQKVRPCYSKIHNLLFCWKQNDIKQHLMNYVHFIAALQQLKSHTNFLKISLSGIALAAQMVFCYISSPHKVLQLSACCNKKVKGVIFFKVIQQGFLRLEIQMQTFILGQQFLACYKMCESHIANLQVVLWQVNCLVLYHCCISGRTVVLVCFQS